MGAKSDKTTGDRKEVRAKNARTTAARLEGKVKNIAIKPIKKPKRKTIKTSTPHKPQSYTAQQRKDYQLRSKRRSAKL